MREYKHLRAEVQATLTSWNVKEKDVFKTLVKQHLLDKGLSK